DTLLANSKIAADTAAKRIRTNIAYFDDAIKGYETLFADRPGLVVKQLDDLRLVVDSRIAKHKADEAAKEEATRARIQREIAEQEIDGIRHQLMIAQVGRAGVRKGGTIECIRETLAETEAWVIDGRFGALQADALAVKSKTVAAIKELLARA